jgi:hypothetical protein
MNLFAKQGSLSLRRQAILFAAGVIGVSFTAVQVRAEEGFIADQKGCKVANPSPKPKESVQWNGQCVNGYADGKGVLQWYTNNEPNSRYEGTLRRGQLSGQGTLTMPNGASYAGQWVAGKQEGKGVQSMPDGSRYEGEWKNGQPDGRGVLRNAAGETLDGHWSEGAYVGPEEKKDPEEKK